MGRRRRQKIPGVKTTPGRPISGHIVPLEVRTMADWNNVWLERLMKHNSDPERHAGSLDPPRGVKKGMRKI